MTPDYSDILSDTQQQKASSNSPDSKLSKSPVISVIIPAYNYAHFLPYTLKSLLTQNGVTIEIIVVDDGSTDDTNQVAASFGDAIHYIHQENQGLSAARNTGLRAAKGEFIVFLDADDMLYSGTLLSQYETFQRNPQADVVVCHNLFFREIDPKGTFISPGFPLAREALALDFCCHNIAPVHAYMVRRSITDAVGFFDESLLALEDYDFWLRYVNLGDQIVINPLGLALYRQHGQSMSKNHQQQLLHEALLRGRVESLLENSTSFMKGLKANGWIAHAARCFSLAVSLRDFAKGVSLELVNSGDKALQNAISTRSSSETDSLYSAQAKNLTLYYALLSRRSLDNLSSYGVGYFQDTRKKLKGLYSEVPLGKQQREKKLKELSTSLILTTPINKDDVSLYIAATKNDK